jgi:hypothetical protein
MGAFTIDDIENENFALSKSNIGKLKAFGGKIQHLFVDILYSYSIISLDDKIMY